MPEHVPISETMLIIVGASRANRSGFAVAATS